MTSATKRVIVKDHDFGQARSEPTHSNGRRLISSPGLLMVGMHVRALEGGLGRRADGQQSRAHGYSNSVRFVLYP